jgi:hypothetical protein
MSKRKGKNPDHLTVEEAASILGVGQAKVQEYFYHGRLTRKRASNGEVRVAKAEAERAAHIDALLEDWPPLTPRQAKVVASLLYGEDIAKARHSEPTAYEVEQRRKSQEREDALKSAKKLAEAMTACDVCDLQPDAHHYQKNYGMGYHEWIPGRAEKVMSRG